MTDDQREELTKRLQPRDEKEPLQRNAFEIARSAGTTLTPVFPYLRAGDIVPAISVFQGRDDANWGFFEHYNTVDEIVFSFGSTEGSFIRTGEITSGARTHAVTAPINDHGDSSVGVLVGVIQRQDEDEDADQQEAIIFRCTNCNHELFRHEFDGRNNDIDNRPRDDEYFLSPYMGDDAARLFNDDLSKRTCDNCGHENHPFPVDPWGWKRYREQCDLADSAKQLLIDSATTAGKRRRKKKREASRS